MTGIYRNTVLTKSKVEYWDTEINHYVGCGNGCLYPCWAFLLAKRFSRTWWKNKLTTYDDWVNTKPIANAVELVDREVPKFRHKIKRVLLCGTSDAYQSLEKEVGLTKRILEKLIEYRVQFTVLTKNSLVLRDLELFKGYDKCCLGMSITCEPEYPDKDKWEPYSSSIQDRIDTIKTFHRSGVKTWVSLEPILPYSNPFKLVEILKDDVDWWVFGCLNPAYRKIDKDWYVRIGIELKNLADSLGLNYYVKREYRKLIESVIKVG